MNLLKIMFKQQRDFIALLQKYRDHPNIPFDITDKKSQQFLRQLAFECMGELFEANIHLKNSKSHRKTNIVEFDRDKYIEELSDVLHYFFGIAICSGVTSDELYEAYMTKGETNVKRILDGY
jgi:hypothetical protein